MSTSKPVGDFKPSDLLKPGESKVSNLTKSSSVSRNKKVQSSAVLSDVHKQKLRNAILIALEEEGMKMKNKLFKICFKKLFKVCKPFALDVIGCRGSTSKNMEKIARAHVKQVIEFEQLKMKK